MEPTAPAASPAPAPAHPHRDHHARATPAAEIELRLFKARYVAQCEGRSRKIKVDPALCTEMWEDGQFWSQAGAPVGPPRTMEKYPGRVVRSLALPDGVFPAIVVPCRAIAICRYAGETQARLGREFDAYEVQYETVLVHEPRPATDGMVLIDLKEPTVRPDLTGLKPQLWLQLGEKADDAVFLLRLQLYAESDSFVCKDDVTGEFYPYVLKEAHCLLR